MHGFWAGYQCLGQGGGAVATDDQERRGFKGWRSRRQWAIATSAPEQRPETAPQDRPAATPPEESPAAADSAIDEATDAGLQVLQELLLGDRTATIDARLEQLREKQQELEHHYYDPKAVINWLAPLIDRVIHEKIRSSRDEMCQSLTPLIDELIYQRSREDRRAMSRALAEIVPAAIERCIADSPQTIAKALAPEVADAIRLQIELDREAIIDTLAPEMGRSIKRQIELERDSMVDALYPVIGNTIRKYMREVVRTINEKVSTALTAEGIGRKIRARVQGVSEAELILRESIDFEVMAALLIHKSSGLVMVEVQREDGHLLESEMFAGMLTAIGSFVRDCIAEPDAAVSDLNEIEYGESRILVEMTGYCYLATITRGDLPKAAIDQLRRTLQRLVLYYGREMEAFNGDRAALPPIIQQSLQNLVDSCNEMASKAKKPPGPPWLLVALLGGAAAVVMLSTLWGGWQAQRRSALLTAARGALADRPELAIYNLGARFEGGAIAVTGRVPQERLKTLAFDVAAAAIAAADGDRRVVNRIQAVRQPPDPVAAAAEVARLTAIFNEQPGTRIQARYQINPSAADSAAIGVVVLDGQTLQGKDLQTFERAYARIPGVGNLENRLRVVRPGTETRLYFGVGSPQPVAIDTRYKIDPVRRFLVANPAARLRIIGHSPADEPNGGDGLARDRAERVRAALIAEGIAPQRLAASGTSADPPQVSASDPQWTRRCVRFETVPPERPFP